MKKILSLLFLAIIAMDAYSMDTVHNYNEIPIMRFDDQNSFQETNNRQGYVEQIKESIREFRDLLFVDAPFANEDGERDRSDCVCWLFLITIAQMRN